jgi:uncharacterized membrane protein YebE (DUF533 family)
MALPDRLTPLCDLLLGAAYADDVFENREREEVRGMLEDLGGGTLAPELADRITKFDPKKFDMAKTAKAFAADPIDDRKRVLFLVAAINEADDEIDFAEDDYLRALCKALELPDEALTGLTLDVEIDDMRQDFEKIKKGPPPVPKKGESVDVDID